MLCKVIKVIPVYTILISQDLIQKEIIIEGAEPYDVLGVNNKNLKVLQHHFSKLKIISRGNNLFVNGEIREIERFENGLAALCKLSQKQGVLDINMMESVLGKIDVSIV